MYHLDQFELKKLGWELDQCTKDGCYYDWYSPENGFFSPYKLIVGGRDLGYFGENMISVYPTAKNDQREFTGRCNDISELRVIMEQIGMQVAF